MNSSTLVNHIKQCPLDISKMTKWKWKVGWWRHCYDFQKVRFAAGLVFLQVQWLSMVWDKIPMIWDIIDLANYSLDLHADLTKFDHHKNSNAGDTKK